MKMQMLVCLATTVLILTGCPTTRPLDQQNQQNLREFGPKAVANSTQFLRGAPVSSESATLYIQQFSSQNPEVRALIAKTPKNLGILLSPIQPQTNSLQGVANLIPAFSKFKLQPQAGGNACGPATPPLDNDGDGIPNLFNYTFDCGGAFYDGKAAVLTGTVFIDDKGDNDPNSGYDVKLTNLIFATVDTTVTPNTAYGFGTNLDTQVKVGSGGKYTISQSLEFAVVEVSGNKVSTSEYISNGTFEYTPQANAASNDRFGRGTLKFDNKFAFKLNKNGEKYESSLQFSSTGMIVDRDGCGSEKMVNSGNVKFTDGKNTLTWTITGCGDGTWNYQ